jgi:Rieske Fe-S protein
MDVPDGAFPRKTFLVTAGGFVASVIGLPVLIDKLAAPNAPTRQGAVDLGPAVDFPSGEYVITTFLADPTAGEVSRRTAYIRNNGLLGTRPSFTILSSRCTHVGCPTQPNGLLEAKRQRLERPRTGEVRLVPVQASSFGCPCQGSVFDGEGNRTAGPAVRALDRYPFAIVNGRLVVGSPYSVSNVVGTGAGARIHAFPLRDPGEPVTGVESLLYPIPPQL